MTTERATRATITASPPSNPGRRRFLLASGVTVAGFGLYGCSGDGSGGSENGNTVPAPNNLQITSQPIPTGPVQAGNTASFTVTASSNTAITYQWQKDGVDIIGANSSNYTTPALQLSDSGSLFSVVLNSGSHTVTSTAVAVTVTTPPPLSITADSSVVTIDSTAIDASRA